MLIHRKRRLYFIALVLAGSGIAVAFALTALRQNINLYQTPQQIIQQQPSSQRVFRLGGMVVPGSVQQGDDLKVKFTLTDYQAKIQVEYQGVLPSLFREGQGIVAQGHLNSQGVFIADQVLAKHDANYHPPGVALAKMEPQA
ncbi:MAG: cytochrome c maturation protein CcmE [Proteobacteria bacterium]|nr:cytochrome c maturation protein CcmE [Pseudomonadota bacterium]